MNSNADRARSRKGRLAGSVTRASLADVQPLDRYTKEMLYQRERRKDPDIRAADANYARVARNKRRLAVLATMQRIAFWPRACFVCGANGLCGHRDEPATAEVLRQLKRRPF